MYENCIWWKIWRHDCVAAFAFSVQLTTGLWNQVQFLLTRMARDAGFGTLTPAYPASLMPPPPSSSPCPPRPWPPPPPEAAPPPPHDLPSQPDTAASIHPAARGSAQAGYPFLRKCGRPLQHPRPPRPRLQRGAKHNESRKDAWRQNTMTQRIAFYLLF